MAEPLYKKYGTRALQPTLLQTGLDQQRENYDSILTNIEDAFADQKARAVETNTSAMEARLRERVRAGGLGGRPVDTAPIRSRYDNGDLIDMERLEGAALSEKTAMEREARSDATAQALKYEDPLQARDALRSHYEKLGATPEFIASETASFSTQFANRFQDLATMETRAEEASFERARMAHGNGGDFFVTLEADIQKNLPKHKWKAAREKGKTYWENISKIGETQLANIAHETENMKAVGAEELGYLEKQVETAKAEQAALLAAGPDQHSRELANIARATLGKSVPGQITEDNVNWLESLYVGDDGEEVQQFYETELLKVAGTEQTRATSEEAQAALAQAYSDVMGTSDVALFQNIDGGQMIRIKARANKLLDNLTEAKEYNTKISDFEQEKSDAAARISQRERDFRKSLMRAARNRSRGFADAPRNAEAAASLFRGDREGNFGPTRNDSFEPSSFRDIVMDRLRGAGGAPRENIDPAARILKDKANNEGVGLPEEEHDPYLIPDVSEPPPPLKETLATARNPNRNVGGIDVGDEYAATTDVIPDPEKAPRTAAQVADRQARYKNQLRGLNPESQKTMVNNWVEDGDLTKAEGRALLGTPTATPPAKSIAPQGPKTTKANDIRGYISDAMKGLSETDRTNVDPDFVFDLVFVESGGKADAKNPDSSALGLSQAIKSTAKEYGYSQEDLKDPKKAVELTVKIVNNYSKDLRNEKIGGMPLAVTPFNLRMAYLNGPTGLKKLLFNRTAKIKDLAKLGDFGEDDLMASIQKDVLTNIKNITKLTPESTVADYLKHFRERWASKTGRS